MWTGTTMADPESMAAARRGKRVLLMGETVTLAHIARPVVLAQGLHRAGYTVYLAADPRYQSLLPALPFPTYDLRSGAPDDFLRRIDMGSALFDVDTLERYVQEDLALFRELAPHVVIGDMRHSLAVSSRLYGIPYLNVINANWSPYCDSELVLMEHPLMDLVGEPLVQTLFGLMRPLGGTLHSLPLNVVCARHGLPMLGTDPKQVYTYGDFTLYPDTPALIPTRKLPFNHLYIGPILWSPNVARPRWWGRSARRSTGHLRQPGQFGECLTARGDRAHARRTAGHRTGGDGGALPDRQCTAECIRGGFPSRRRGGGARKVGHLQRRQCKRAAGTGNGDPVSWHRQ